MNDHPAPDVLRLWIAGKLEAERAGEVESHVEGCGEVCQPLLDRLGAFDDETVSAPRRDGETASMLASRLSLPPGFKFIKVLGEGGFGTVLLAEQQRPIRRQVAIKIIKLGMDTRQVIARFEAERQALAMMDHPGIAKVLDAGATQSGRPCFVMELVKGVPITQYCDTNRLSISDRLDLFIQICLAVQHAHQKGIIHRDLKPSNVLVTTQDGKPVPKVIDFGIAKATSGRLTDLTLQTASDSFIGTPEYMSPEQAETSALDIDTRTDIYALGVMLYELLTGATPFDGKALRTQGFDGIRRTLREVEPPRPSMRLHALGAELPTLASRRRIEPRRLEEALRGELDWIVMKAMEKDRTRRYDTAQGLSRDVQRYLRDEPVQARPTTAGYRFGKFVRKHKAGATTAAAIAIALVLGIIGTAVGMSRAKSAEQIATQKKNQVVALLDEVKQAQAQAQRHAELAEAAKKRSDEEAQIARVASVQSQIAEADALLRAGERYQAEYLYEGALAKGEKLGMSSWPAKLGIFDAYRTVRPPILTIHPGHRVRGVDFLPGDRSAITLSEDGVFEVWDLPTGRQVRSFGKLVPRAGDIFALSPDGTAILGGSHTNNSTQLQAWDVPNARPLYTISTADRSPVSFSPDGKYVCLGGRNLQVYDAKTGAFAFRSYQKRGDEKPEEGWRFRSDISPDDHLGICGKFGVIRLQDLKSGAVVAQTLTPEYPQVHVAFPSGGNYALISDDSGNLRRWAYNSNAPAVEFADRHTREISQLRTSADGRFAFSSSKDRTFRKWDIDSLRSMGVVGFSHDGFRSFGLSRDEKLIVASSAEGEISLWSLDEPPWAVAEPAGDRKVCTGIGASPDGMLIVAACDGDSALRVGDSATGQLLGSIGRDSAEQGYPSLIRVSADGAFVLSAMQGEDGVFRGIARWDLPSRQFHYMPVPKGETFEQIYIPNDACILTQDAGDHRIRIWDARTLRESDENSAESQGALDPDTRVLLDAVRRQGMELPVTTARGGLYAANPRGQSSPRPNQSPQNLELRRVGDPAFKTVIDVGVGSCGAALAPDGSILFQACADGNLRAFDPMSGRLIRAMPVHIGYVQTIAVSATGDRLFSGGDDRTVRAWDFGRVEEIRRLEPLQSQARATLQDDPDDPASLKMLGRWYVLQGQWSWALDLLLQARAHGVTVPHLTLARCHWMLSDFDAAEQEFTAAIQSKEASENYLNLCRAAVRTHLGSAVPQSH